VIEYKSKLVEYDKVSTKPYPSSDELNCIDNAVLIEGPNDFGKSILLHCIALSAYGLDFYKEDPKKINEELKKKLDWLIDPEMEFSKIEYNLIVTYNRGGDEINFTCNKSLDSSEFDRKLNDNRLIFNNFKKDFNLIYDIPSNPTKRLEELLVESEVKLNDIHNIVDNFNNYLTEINSLLDEDPKEKLKNYEKVLINLKENKETAEKKYGNVQEERATLKKYQVIKELDACSHSLKEKYPKFNEVKKELSSLKGAKVKKSRSKSVIRKFYVNSENYNEELFDHLEDIGINTEKAIEKELAKFKNLDMANDIQNNEGKGYYSIIYEIEMCCNQLQTEVVNPEINQNVEFLITLKEVIDKRPDVIDNDDIGPDIKIFLETIDKYLTQHADSEFQENFDNIFDVINKIKTNITDGVEAYSNLSKDENLTESESNYESLSAKYDALDIRIKALEKDEKKWAAELKKLEKDMDTETFKTVVRHKYGDAAKLSLKDFSEHLHSLDARTRSARKSFHDIEIKVDAQEKLIEELQNAKRPKFSADKDIITNILDELNSIIFNTGNQFKTYFKSLSSSNSAVENDKEEKFRQSLFRYISTKTPTINHAGNDYEVELIDPIKKTITTKDGRTIDFQSFGTGRSQSASLLNRINSLDPKKKNIVLFDEIAHMDNKSLQPIKDRLKELYENGTIFIAILVQKADEIKVQSLLT